MNTTDQPDAGGPVPTPKWWFLGGAFAVMAVLLFAELGHYALWDDEANTALIAKGVLRTGDTSIVLDHGNIVADRGGIDLVGLHDRAQPPLAFYITAASFELFGIDAFTARLPFALLGLGAVALMLLWVRRESWPVVLVLTAGLIGNVSFILFFRQCRYYGPAIFFTLAVVFLYWRWKPTPRHLLFISGLSVLLFLANYLNYLALYLCLAVDWFFWRRREWQPSRLGWLCLLGPQVVLNGILSLIWNPIRTPYGSREAFNTVWDRLTLFYWYLRDIDRCEFFALPLILLALYIGLAWRREWLVRGCVALVVYVGAVSLVSPQNVAQAMEGEVRYLTPLIPLGLALETGVLCALFGRRRQLLAVAAVVVFGTNLLNYWPAFDSKLHPWHFRSTPLSFLGELGLPQQEPYTPTARWINDHVPEGSSIWVMPGYAAYPLMFHAPKATYAWQLFWPPRPDQANLPPIDYIGRVLPDYLIGFGPTTQQAYQILQTSNGTDPGYRLVATINVYWQDAYRPELYWRNFESTTDFDPNTEAVYIFKRFQLAPQANSAPK